MTPIQTDQNHVNTITDATIEQAQANALFAVTAQVAAFNAQLKAAYLNVFQNWAVSVAAGRIDASNPPQPPKAYVVDYFTDPTTGPTSEVDKTPRKWPFPSQAGGPVTPQPPVPGVVHHTLGKGQIGIRLSGNFFSELPGDTTPDNEEAPGTSTDGVTGIFRKIASPFGSNAATGEVGGWFFLVRPI
jgi:hypothetical protein